MGAGRPLGSFQPEALKGAFPLELPLWEGRQVSWCGVWQRRTWSWRPHPAVPGPSPANSNVTVQLCRGVLGCISGRPGDYSVSYLYTSINPLSLNHLEWILLLVVENWPLPVLITFNTVMFLVSSVLQQHILCFSKLRQCPLYTVKCYLKNQTTMALFWDTSVILLQNHSFGISWLQWEHDAESVAEQLWPNNCIPCFLNRKVSSLYPLHTCKH